jgi:hypothetical protein
VTGGIRTLPTETWSRAGLCLVELLGRGTSGTLALGHQPWGLREKSSEAMSTDAALMSYPASSRHQVPIPGTQWGHCPVSFT